jgi:hypothetical protein
MSRLYKLFSALIFLIAISGCISDKALQSNSNSSKSNREVEKNGGECVPPETPLSPAKLALLKKDVKQRHTDFEKALQTDKRMQGARLKIQSSVVSGGRGCASSGLIIVTGNVKSVKQKHDLWDLIEEWRLKPTSSGRAIEIGAHI